MLESEQRAVTEVIKMMFFGRNLGKSKSIVTKRQAVQIARAECKKQDWPWIEPVEISSKFGKWVVRTNSQAIGASARIIIDKQTGKIKKAGYLPR